MKKLIVLINLSLLLLIACNENQKDGSSAYSDKMDMDTMVLEEAEIPQAKMAPRGIESKEIQDQKIIKTGYYTFETPSIDNTYKKLASWVQSNKGYIQNDNTRKEYNSMHRSLVIRIPSMSFQTVVDSIEKNTKIFDRRDISLKDVTEEFVDLEARLKAKRKLEERYLQLLAKAKSVNDMLNIERQIATIREEIEAKQGRLKYLQSQVSLSTLHVEFYEMISVERAPSKTYLSRLGNALKGGFTGLGNFFIGLVYIWPFIILLIVAIFFLRRLLKKRKSTSD